MQADTKFAEAREPSAILQDSGRRAITMRVKGGMFVALQPLKTTHPGRYRKHWPNRSSDLITPGLVAALKADRVSIADRVLIKSCRQSRTRRSDEPIPGLRVLLRFIAGNGNGVSGASCAPQLPSFPEANDNLLTCEYAKCVYSICG